jgi:hypothetical protein
MEYFACVKETFKHWKLLKINIVENKEYYLNIYIKKQNQRT